MHAVAMSVTTLCSVSLNLDKVGSWTIDVQDLFFFAVVRGGGSGGLPLDGEAPAGARGNAPSVPDGRSCCRSSELQVPKLWRSEDSSGDRRRRLYRFIRLRHSRERVNRYVRNNCIYVLDSKQKIHYTEDVS